jgi:indole-3-glycerol phosphate synthase
MDALQRIIAYKHDEVARQLAEAPEADWLARAEASPAPAPRGVKSALRAAHGAGRNALICELKRKSPSAGDILPGADPLDVARDYARSGAACLSVLTDGPSFGGSLDDLRAVRAAVPIPVLRKEFMVHPVQVHETRLVGADAVLVILSAVDDAVARALMAAAEHHGLDVLVEVHDRAELDRAAALGASLIGINNRDLKRMVTELETSATLAAHLPAGCIAVSESGIRTPADIARLRASGFRTFLIGESLMLSSDRRGDTFALSTAGTN